MTRDSFKLLQKPETENSRGSFKSLQKQTEEVPKIPSNYVLQKQNKGVSEILETTSKTGQK